jgi:transposase
MRKLTRRMQKVNAEVIGLDIHKDLIAYCILDRKGDEIASGRIGGRPDDLRAFVLRRVGRRKTHLAFEASGSSWWAYDLLCGLYGAERVHVAQSKRIRMIANSQEKNDANDAFWLAYLTHEGRLPEAYVPPPAYLELRIATRERTKLVQRRTGVIKRLRAHLRQLGERVPTSTVRTQEARAFLARMAEETPGMRGAALADGLAELERLDRKIGEWDERIAERTQDLPDVAAVEEHLPGAGRVLAATIVAESGPVQRFTSAKAYGRYTGLTPSDRCSGGRTIHGGISREGSPHLRWAFTQAANACLRARRGVPYAVGEWTRAKQRRMSIKAKARCAAARKLAESLWRLFVYGECFDAARAFRGARPVR